MEAGTWKKQKREREKRKEGEGEREKFFVLTPRISSPTRANAYRYHTQLSYIIYNPKIAKAAITNPERVAAWEIFWCAALPVAKNGSAVWVGVGLAEETVDEIDPSEGRAIPLPPLLPGVGYIPPVGSEPPVGRGIGLSPPSLPPPLEPPSPLIAMDRNASMFLSCASGLEGREKMLEYYRQHFAAFR